MFVSIIVFFLGGENDGLMSFVDLTLLFLFRLLCTFVCSFMLWNFFMWLSSSVELKAKLQMWHLDWVDFVLLGMSLCNLVIWAFRAGLVLVCQLHWSQEITFRSDCFDNVPFPLATSKILDTVSPVANITNSFYMTSFKCSTLSNVSSLTFLISIVAPFLAGLCSLSSATPT